MKRTTCYVLSGFALIFAFKAVVLPERVIAISAPKSPVETVLSGNNWAYAVPFEVTNKGTIEKLIQCESQGVNISRPDKGGLYSDGILQFHRGASDIMGSGTWSDMEKSFSFEGSPIVPTDAIRMADLMISGGFLGRWTCAHILGLVAGRPS